jgi:hypothetical protein
MEAADEHRRVEVAGAHAETAEARAAAREAQARAEERRDLIAELRRRLADAEASIRRSRESDDSSGKIARWRGGRRTKHA